MIDWLKYFFGGFLSNERSRQCQWRSLGNTALGALLAFAVLVCGLTWGYQASFGTIYRGAGEFHSFLYRTLEEADFTVTDGIATGSTRINTYESGQEGYQLIIDLRDTEHLYDDFTLLCRSETRGEIPYEEYLAQPAQVQQDYTEFAVAYSGKELDLQAGYEAWHGYLKAATADTQSALYKKEVAEAFEKLEQEKPQDYYEQLYLLYVQAYYPALNLREYGAKAPTIHGYYFEKIAGDAEGKLLALFRDGCYVGFQSGSRGIFFVGDYDGISKLEPGQEGADALMHAAFRSGSQTDYMMYIVNVFGLLFAVIIAWLVLAVLVWLVSKKRRLEATRMFGGAAQLVGSYLLGSSVVAAAIAFATSFLLSQGTVYYLSAAVLILTLGVRTLMFLFSQEPTEE